MCYLKVFIEILGMGEWAPPFFYAASATPLGVYGVIRLWLMGEGGGQPGRKPSKQNSYSVQPLDKSPVDQWLTRLCTVWMHSRSNE
jgi:hypothetical protein